VSGFGGEDLSLALNYTSKAAFASAGYADIKVNSSEVVGKVRQHGVFSFSRVFQAGHESMFLTPPFHPPDANTIRSPLLRPLSCLLHIPPHPPR